MSAVTLLKQLDDLEHQIGSSDDEPTNWQAKVYSGTALGFQWRSVVEILSRTTGFTEYRTYRGQFLAMVAETLAELDATLEAAPCEVLGRDALETARAEVLKIGTWVETWPVIDEARRQRSRDEHAAGESTTVEEMLRQGV